jgi:dienelactone hydrolase
MAGHPRHTRRSGATIRTMKTAGASLLLLACLPVRAHSQRLHLPRAAAADSAFHIRADGLQAGTEVVLRAEMDDSQGRRWSSAATFRVAPAGRVDLVRDAPLRGSYAGVQPLGLVTAMQTAGEALARFIPGRLDSIPLTVYLEVAGRAADSASVLRRLQGPGVTVRDLRGSRPLGRIFLPPGGGRRPAVLVIGGSEGGFGGDDVAALLASHGYAALSIAYFGAGSLPDALERIPLEYFVAAVDSLRATPGVDPGRIAVLGTSKGAEAALLLAADDARVRAVVAYAPSAVAWSCICRDPRSPSWTLGAGAVPFVPGGRDPAYLPAPGTPLRPVVNYRYRLRDSASVLRAAIPVERIAGPVLMVAGRDDQLWPSAWSAAAITERLRAHGFRHQVVNLTYAGAGHLIGKAYLPAGATRTGGGRLETGGSPHSNAAAQADAWPRVLRFLRTALR